MDLLIIIVGALLFLSGSLWLSRGLDRVKLRQQRFQNNAPKPPLTSDASAKRLVRGIAEMHPVCVFLRTSAKTASENDLIILDSLSLLGITVKVVDTSKDSEISLGLPQIDEVADLPQLYVAGKVFGGVKTVLDAIPSGALASSLDAASIPYDKAATAQLMRT